MNKKFLYSLALIPAMFVFMQTQSFAITSAAQKVSGANVNVEVENSTDEADIIKKVSFRDKFRRSPEVQINNFFKKYNKYSAQNNLEKLKELYTDDYINNDGFNKRTIFQMMEMAADSYQDVSYDTIIDNIKVDGNYAVVDAHETAVGKTSKKIDKVNDYGTITSDIKYTDYLRKVDNEWKISSTVVNDEVVTLTYGEAKDMGIEISAPNCVPEGSEYEVDVKTSSPDGVFMVGSIVNEPIIYPQVQNIDVFRSVKSDEIARVLKSNTDGNNEYATLSIAVTRAQIEPPSVILNMTGMAFVMKRVNVISVNKNIKIDEAASNVNAKNKK